jgi:hypothetical protein
MSQILFFTTDGREVMAGWDRPCADYFLTVFDKDQEVIWSAITDWDEADRTSTTRLEAKLVELGIEVPEGFWDRVRSKFEERYVFATYPVRFLNEVPKQNVQEEKEKE